MKIKDSKLLLKILSAVAAVVLWFAITYTEDPVISQLLTDIDIVFEGEDTLHANGLIVINKDAIPDISATIRGNRSSVISSVGAVSAVIDLSRITQTGKNMVEVKYNYPSSSVVLAKAKTRELTLETEKIVTRNIPVRVETANEDKNAAFITDAKSDVELIKVSGAESVIYKIAYAKATVDVTNITASGELEYFFKLYDSDGDVLPENNILSKSIETLPVKNTVYKKVSLPVEIVLPEEMAMDYALTVKNQSITSVSAGVPEGVDITSLYAIFNGKENDGKTEYTLNLTVPEGVYVPEKSTELTATCELVPKVLKELEIPVTAENVPEGKKVKLTPDKIKISVKGAENLLSASNIKATVDASQLTSGEEQNVEVTLTTDKDIQIVGTYTTAAILE